MKLIKCPETSLPVHEDFCRNHCSKRDRCKPMDEQPHKNNAKGSNLGSK